MQFARPSPDGIIKIEGDPRFSRQVECCVAEPISGRPGIDVETLPFASRGAAQRACTGSGVSHLPELIDHFAGEIEIAFLHGYPSFDGMAGLITVLRSA